MPKIILTPDMLGDIDSEGNLGKRPTQDIFGTEITAMHSTIKRLRFNGKRHFVTIPNGKDHPDNVYELAEEPKPAPKVKD